MEDTSTTDAHHTHQPAQHGTKLPGAFELFKPSWQALKLNWLIIIFGTFPPVLAGLVLIAVLQIIVHVVASSGSTITAVVNVISVILGIVTLVVAIPVGLSLSYWVKLQSAKAVKVGYIESVKKCLHFHFTWCNYLYRASFVDHSGLIPMAEVYARALLSG
jgi:hypothetical protein